MGQLCYQLGDGLLIGSELKMLPKKMTSIVCSLLLFVPVCATLAQEKTTTERIRERDVDDAEIELMKFSWNGNKQPGSDISYTIQSPSLIIEYACRDLGGNPLAHLHSMYRDPSDEYGKQLD